MIGVEDLERLTEAAEDLAGIEATKAARSGRRRRERSRTTTMRPTSRGRGSSTRFRDGLGPSCPPRSEASARR
ncbi:hypothetical protein [Actinomyces israelii]|uniref:hypothetical protein n=1 Tax=Actinomyces israelii TaxID=1659 RepID=UPI0025522326|nr:hypothetical protein [Actinomyces israelii]